MFVPLPFVFASFFAGLFFLFNFGDRVRIYNFFSIIGQAPTFPAEFAGTVDAILKSLGIHGFVYVVLYISSIWVELPMLKSITITQFLLSVALLAWPIFYSRRSISDAVLKAFNTPDRKDDLITMVDIFFRSAGVCQLLFWLFMLISEFLG
jgi:hypothetical protein